METAEDGRIKRTASIAGGQRQRTFFLYFAEDDLSDLFRPTERVDLTARVWICSSSSPPCVWFFFNFVCSRQLGLDLVPRQEFSMVDPDEISVTELYRLVSVFFRCSALKCLLLKTNTEPQREKSSSVCSSAVSLHNRISGCR